MRWRFRHGRIGMQKTTVAAARQPLAKISP
jgi:hypothetical protein